VPESTNAQPRLSPRSQGASDEAFLQLLGQRIRKLRTRRPITRKILARDAAVSERHLAQLESGGGNVSIVLLSRIASALNVSLAELLTPDTDEAVERRLIQRFLERLPAHRLEDVVYRLMRDFGSEENARRARIALIGLRGAGKSTLGTKLGEDLKVPFVELDREIENDTGMPLAEIFSLYGQSGYRAIEKRTLERVMQEHHRGVFSIGGGVVSEKETYEYLLSHCYTIWIKAQPEEHMSRVIAQGDLRAMTGSDRAMEDLRRILESREPLYRKADTTVDTAGTSVEESFARLKAALEIRP
jgi:XRE family transcriptional regulator, aerobic/anaerobic benzoate catabolism transcriptional regulator